MKQFCTRTLILVLSLLLCASVGQARYKKIELHSELSSGLNQVLVEAVALHQVLYKRDVQGAKVQLTKLVESVEVAKARVHSSRYAMHLQKVLASMKTYLLTARAQQGESKLKLLAGAFQQVVQIARTYKLKQYSIFFCGKDRAVWIQESPKAANPIHPETQCGVRVS